MHSPAHQQQSQGAARLGTRARRCAAPPGHPRSPASPGPIHAQRTWQRCSRPSPWRSPASRSAVAMWRMHLRCDVWLRSCGRSLI